MRLHATRAAVSEGIVPGGGVALLRAVKSLDKSEAYLAMSRSALRSSAMRPSLQQQPLQTIVASKAI